VLETLVAFVAVSAVVICTPGQDTALTIRNTLAGGRRGGVATAAGVSAGQAVWTIAASAGIVALLSASEPVFRAIKLAGAAYLVYLGLQSLVSAVRGYEHLPTARTRGDTSAVPRAFRQGLLSNLGNPKMAVFFTSLLPQFASTFAGLLTLGLVFATMTLAWLSLHAVAVAHAGELLQRPKVRRTIDVVVGTVLVAFGLRLATDRG
jgi:threonine/homoserine/homoserine lactone efflux protein